MPSSPRSRHSGRMARWRWSATASTMPPRSPRLRSASPWAAAPTSALETADAALLKSRVGGVAELVELSRATLTNIRQNVTVALGLKAVFLVTSLLGITTLWMAILADTGATVLVTLNALAAVALHRSWRKQPPVKTRTSDPICSASSRRRMPPCGAPGARQPRHMPGRPRARHLAPRGRSIMRTSTFGLTIAALVAAAAVIGWAVSLWIPGGETSSEVSEGQGPVITSEFELVDQDGRTVRGEDLRGKLQLVFFGFTTCPDICPTTLTKITAALEELGADADTLRPVLMTVDPERDTPAVLKEYLSAFDPRIIGLTGTPEQVEAALRKLPGLRQQALSWRAATTRWTIRPSST